MERTIMESFCAASNFRGFLKRPDLPSTIREIADAIELPSEVRGTLDMQSLYRDFGKAAPIKIPKEERDNARLQDLDDDVISALRGISESITSIIGQSWSPPRRAVKEDRMVFEGSTFSVEKTTKSMGLICTKSGNTYVPGKLREIISIAYPDSSNDKLLRILYLLVVHQHVPASSKIRNPFRKYPEFGANLWSNDCYARPSIAPVVPGMQFCHGIFRNWDEKHIVVKAVNRVGERLVSRVI